ncbi:hypothetical protein FE257_000878 [Aspergillus nanangensis]|uniref:Zn(2)-C6 fungal-type domain-containing protein n=1 Tax=Aspergillus nanangensis TaxID=2582783 RepID=A0AAD4GR24_ASPNN|nr:hypothetical protein FE257_000878 [Aspergillus nanangensis]
MSASRTTFTKNLNPSSAGLTRGRASYVFKACLRCRQQKTKCTGRNPCEQCCRKNLECVYPSGPARRRARRKINRSVGVDQSPATTLKEQNHCKEAHLTPDTAAQTPPVRSITTEDRDVVNHLEHMLLSPEYTVSTCVNSPSTKGISKNKPHWRGLDAAAAAAPTLNRWDMRSKLLEVQFMRRTVETYLAKVNPFLPCFNVTQMRSDVEDMLAGELPSQEMRPVVAAVDLMTAAMKAMTEDAACISRSGRTMPGWAEYERAEHLLRDGCYSNGETLRTLQCSLVKVLYLATVDKFHLAYDTMGTVARLCYQLELHDERRWHNRSSFEIHLCQRILWTAFFLDRHIAQNWKAPYLLRESDLDVALPRHIDDRKLKPDSMLLPEEENHAPIAPLDTCSQYARLYSEIWDRVLTVKASRSFDPEVIAAIARRVKDLRLSLPIHLQWKKGCCTSLGAAVEHHPSHFHLRQSVLLHLQMNNLHLLLHHGGVVDTDDVYIDTAIDSIHTIWEYDQANLHDPIERIGSTRYLLTSMKTLSWMVLRRYQTRGCVHPTAIEALSRGISVLETFAPHLTLAQMALDQLRMPIQEVVALEQQSLPSGQGEQRSMDFHPDATTAPYLLDDLHTELLPGGNESWLEDITDLGTVNFAWNSDCWLDGLSNTAMDDGTRM